MHGFMDFISFLDFELAGCNGKFKIHAKTRSVKAIWEPQKKTSVASYHEVWNIFMTIIYYLNFLILFSDRIRFYIALW